VAGSFLFSQFMGGLTTAMFLFLIASGLSLVFGVMRVINFAHGSFYMIGAYLAWQGVQWLPDPRLAAGDSSNLVRKWLIQALFCRDGRFHPRGAGVGNGGSAGF